MSYEGPSGSTGHRSEPTTCLATVRSTWEISRIRFGSLCTTSNRAGIWSRKWRLKVTLALRSIELEGWLRVDLSQCLRPTECRQKTPAAYLRDEEAQRVLPRGEVPVADQPD